MAGVALLVFVAIARLVIARQRQTRIALLRTEWGRRTKRTHKLGVIADTHKARATYAQEPALDRRTADDLNLSDVFVEIDRTTSTLGRDALFHRLRTLDSAERLQDFEALVTLFSENAGSRERAQLALTRLQDPNGYDVWWLGHPQSVPRRRWHAVFPVLTLLTVSALATTIAWHAVWPALPLLIAIDLGVWFIAREDIGALTLAMRQIAPLVATGEGLAFLGNAGSRLTDRMGDDAAALRRLKHVARWLSGDPLMLSFRLEGSALVITAVATMVYEYLNIALLLDANGVLLASADLRKRGSALVRLAGAIGDVDTALSVASWRAERTDWTRPRFVAAGSMTRLEQVRHPLVSDAVPNTLTLQSGRGMLITGSNMSGKSTFLRTVGVNAVLAQRLNTCLASEYEAPFFAVRSCIGRSDDIISGKSYYLVEVEAVLALVEAAEDPHPHLFLFDELFRGTNTVERVSAAQAVLAALVEHVGCSRPHVVLAATHDGELVSMLRENYEPFHFSDRIGADGLVFDFLLKSGPSTTRNAITLLSQRGAPARIVARALATASVMDEPRGMAS